MKGLIKFDLEKKKKKKKKTQNFGVYSCAPLPASKPYLVAVQYVMMLYN